MSNFNILFMLLALGLASTSMAQQSPRSHVFKASSKLPEAECARFFRIISPRKSQWVVVGDDAKKSLVYRINGNDEIREMIYQWTSQVDADQVERRSPSGIHLGFARGLFLSMVAGEIQSQRVSRYPVAFGEFTGTLTIESSPEDSKFVSMTFEVSHPEWGVSQSLTEPRD
jgi:hypothetical protein